MHEWKPAGKAQREQPDLEKRLSAYYGPELREQTLPPASWLRLRSKLGAQPAFHRWRIPRLHTHRLRPQSTPAFVQTAFSRILYEARLPWSSSLLYCAFKTNVRVPSVRVSLFTRHNIRLTLSSNLAQTVGSSELDLLLATGLARYVYLRKPVYILLRVLVAALVAMAGVSLVIFWRSGIPYLELPIAMVLCAILSGYAYIEKRKLSLRSDDMIVRWLGRSAVCQGLHALAGRDHKYYRVGWGEPSLTERISRICGTRATVEDDRLTLIG